MDWVARYLDHVRYEKRLAERTHALYTLDLQKLSDYAKDAGVALEAVQSTHIRRWVSQMHSDGRSGRGIALILSGWRGFYTWLGREGVVQSNPVQDVRAPKAPKPLPKALSVDEAMQLAEFSATADVTDPWLECRDAAMVELLYGCGLRVGELVGLDAQASNTARGWLDLEGAEAHVLGKGSKRRSVPIGSKALLAVNAWLAVREQGLNLLQQEGAVTKGTATKGTATKETFLDDASSDKKVSLDVQSALFIGRHGTRLTAQGIWQTSCRHP